MSKRSIKTLVCLALAALMLLSGCADNGKNNNNKPGENNNQPTGGYREETMIFPTGYNQITNLVFLPDGSMAMVGQRYQSYDDGGGMPVKPMPVDDVVPEEGDTAATEPAEGEEPADTDEQTADASAVPAETETPASAEANTETQPAESETEEQPAQLPEGEYEEYTPPKEQYDIITWKDAASEPVLDPLDLPANAYLSGNNSLMVDEQGNLALMMSGYDPEKGVSQYTVQMLPKPQGAGRDAAPVAPVSATILDMGDVYPNALALLPNGNIAVCDYAGLRIFDSNGKKVKELASGGFIYQMTASGNYLIAVDGDKSELVYYDIQSYAEAYRVPVTRSVMNNMSSMTALDDGSIYFLGQDGVRRMGAPEKQGDQMVAPDVEVVLSALDYKLGDPEYYGSGFAISPQDKRIVVTGNMEGGMARAMLVSASGGYSSGSVAIDGEEYTGPQMFGFIYTWDPTVDFGNKVELEISTLFSDQMLRVAASIFREAHPNVRIKITQYYDKMENDMKWSDFIKAVNTDILSGKGADVMFLDNMPISSYMRRGVLVDLSDMVEQMGGAEKLNMGVIDGMRSDNGKLYAIPMMFNAYALYGRKNVVDQVTDLKSLLTLDLKPDQYALASMQRSEMFNMLLTSNMPAFIDEKTGNYRFDSEEFIGFLELFDRIYKEAQITPPELPENPTEEDWRKYDEIYQKNQINLYKGIAAMQISYFGGLDYMDFTLAGGKEADWTFLPTVKDLGGAVYNPSTMVGINAKSDQKELAAEFIKVLFSDDERLSNYMWGFSTVKAVQERRIQQILDRYKEQDEYGWGNETWVGTDNGQDIMAPRYRMPEEQLREMAARMDECTIPAIYDNTLMEFMMEEIDPFLKQTKSATEVAQALQKRAAAYLAE